MPEINNIINFLTKQFEKGRSFSLINSYKSALSLITQYKLEEEKILKRFIKGISNIKPSRPRYENIWDPEPVLIYLGNLYPLDSLTLWELTTKMVTLLALITGHRIQTLSKIKLSNIRERGEDLEIFISDKIKTTNRTHSQPVLIIPSFKENPKLCICDTIKYYITKTETLRPPDMDTLIVTVKKPHGAASSQTISRYIKQTLKKSGINTQIFKGYSIRHASTSAAFRAGVDIDTIRRTAGWTKKSQVFAQFYNKPIIEENNTFALKILSRK